MLRCCSPPVSPWAWKSIVLGSLHIFRSVLAKDSGWRGPQSLTRCMTTKLKYQISLTLRLFNRSAFFASKGHQRQWKRKKRTAGRKKKKREKHFTKRCSPSQESRQRRGGRVGFSTPIIVTFRVTERIHWITDRQVSGTVISYFEWPVIRIVSERGITDRYRNRFDTEPVRTLYIHTYIEKPGSIGYYESKYKFFLPPRFHGWN